MKRFLKFLPILVALLVTFTLMMMFSSCNTVKVDATQVAVLIDQPIMFGKGGVREYVWGPGLQYTWVSTHEILYQTTPVTYEEHFENIVTKDNNPISFTAYVKIKIISDSAWYLNKYFSSDWYKQNISPRFRTKVRDKSCAYEMFQLTSQRDISAKIEDGLKNEMISYVKVNKIPIIIEEVNIGSIQPQKEVLAEIANTAAKIQNQKTQQAEGKSQEDRKTAEEKRADADMAYKNKMGLTNEQFVQLEMIKMYRDLSGEGSTFIVGNIPGFSMRPQ